MSKLIKNHLSAKDPVLKEIISTLPLPELEPTHHVFHDLMSCIIEQQIHYRSTKKTFQKLLDSASLLRLSPNNFSIFEQKALPNIKLSLKKYETMGKALEAVLKRFLRPKPLSNTSLHLTKSKR